MNTVSANPDVNFYFNKPGPWQDLLIRLRPIMLNSGLSEELKWGCPCYTYNNGNIALIHTFKEYCAILFFKGALIEDQHGILVQQTRNVQSSRQIRFTELTQVHQMKEIITSYLEQAIELEKAGAKVQLKKVEEFEMPEELKFHLEQDSRLRKAFYELTPGRQRGYILYFSSAKQSSTRESRIEKSRENILKGKGLKD